VPDATSGMYCSRTFMSGIALATQSGRFVATDIQPLNNFCVVIELIYADSCLSDHRLCSDTTSWFGKSPVL
jgi:hypothetical protein